MEHQYRVLAGDMRNYKIRKRTEQMSYNIAVDGPAGAGKSTIAKAVAKELNIIYVDTGAMYRGMGLYMLRRGIDPEDEQAVTAHCEEADIALRYEDGVQVVCLNGENVNDYIRTEEVGTATSRISAFPAVRRRVTALQKELADRLADDHNRNWLPEWTVLWTAGT